MNNNFKNIIKKDICFKYFSPLLNLLNHFDLINFDKNNELVKLIQIHLNFKNVFKYFIDRILSLPVTAYINLFEFLNPNIYSQYINYYLLYRYIRCKCYPIFCFKSSLS